MPRRRRSSRQTRESPRLPGVRLDERRGDHRDRAAISRPHDAILLVVPAQALRAVAKALAPALAPGTPVIACAKGIERGTRKFMTEVIAECAPQRGAGDPVRPELRRPTSRAACRPR